MPIDRPQIITLLKSLYLFQKLDDRTLNFIAENIGSVEVKSSDRIFAQDSRAEFDKIFIVLDGKIRLSSIRGGKKYEVGILEGGEIFGYEMLKNNQLHLVSADAITDAALLTLDREQIRVILPKVPGIVTNLYMLYNSYICHMQNNLPWRNRDETVYYMSQTHPFYLLVKLIPVVVAALITLIPISIAVLNEYPSIPASLVALVIDLLVLFSWSFWIYKEWANDFSIITNQRIVYQQRIILLYESRQEAPLNAILSVATDTDYFGRRFGYGDVIVRTYAGSIKLPKLTDPATVKNIVEWLWFGAKNRRSRTESASYESVIRTRLGIPGGKQSGYPTQVPDKIIEPKIQPGFLQTLLNQISKLFILRVDKNGVITYYTHWIFLVRKIWVPSLLFIAYIIVLGMGFIARLSLPPAIVIVLSFIYLTGIGTWFAYNFIDWRNDYYVITNDQILDVYKKPLGKEEKRSAPLKNIQSVEYARIGIIGLVLNFGTVTIKIGDASLTFDNVYDPADVQRELFKRLAERDAREKQTAREAEQKWVVDWISAYHRVVEEQRRTQTQTPPKTGPS